ncbi:hypothetical protein FA13DRAFT_1812301 [Coprinellus micaceus]|uniref:Uncharacterized protein n=1 Tax=Coprinellus micaceus TaxID=71717 RepID=A0A4Y7TI70_COPMI|nr:hypothetical protein FA13DRAFT_1812301 [Coprinellus micaceus]
MSPERVARGHSSGSPRPRRSPTRGAPWLPLRLQTMAFFCRWRTLLADCWPSTGMGNSDNSLSTPPPSPRSSNALDFLPTSQYKQIETGYIESLTPRRQGKALISQSMFDRIWDVLHHPESQLETAQFRFLGSQDVHHQQELSHYSGRRRGTGVPSPGSTPP